ncbi:hypothetical protein BK816_02400 [Boudabousia tangfeifanii]|uniref:DUF1643 domain-containing protein n=1 Tax=Boudabousia tangfeifanii TaxID=1912795 RepID=A0A1D9MJ34_9ACTO|nr:DUF1643 domain-containing protein [Boudabousia tangfeifanii]AOZ72292.1 hypothetical protein BK816_02400 [Boudabousia tangfeifanii]
MEELSVEAFTAAWKNGKLVYPQKPEDYDQRWFLRSKINENKTENLVFIMINPSTATKLSNEGKGDTTTRTILKRFPLNEDDVPRDWRTITLINLAPKIGKLEEFKNLVEDEVREKLLASLEISKQIFETVLPEAHCVQIAWGKLGDDKFPWKPYAICKLKPTFLDSIRKDCKVEAALLPTGTFCHPRSTYYQKMELIDVKEMLEQF